MKKIILIVTIFSISTHLSAQKNIDFNTYSFNTVDGNRKTIHLEKNKQYLLDFWYIECEPCVNDHKLIAKSYQKLAKKHIEVIGMSIDRSKNSWLSYLKKHQYHWKNFNQYRGENNLKDYLGLRWFPAYLLINDNGDVIRKFINYQEVLSYYKIKI